MKKAPYYDILIATVSGTLLFLLLIGFILALLMIYKKRKLAHAREKQQMKDDFEKLLLQSQLEIQEQAFSDISLEIHDNVGQVLSLTKVQLNILEQDNIVNMPILHEAKDNLGKAIIDLRDIAKNLNTDRIIHVSLVENIMSEVARIQRGGVLIVSTRSEGQEVDLHGDKKLILFRIVQECLQNIIKHANTRNVSITFIYQEKELLLVIEDDGKGFNVQVAIEDSQGLGLRNIIRRAGVIGGRVTIKSTIDKGSSITIIIPYV